MALTAIRSRALGLLCTLAACACAEEPAPVPSAVIPEWSLGVLTIRQVVPAMDRAAAYASRVIPASGILGKHALNSYLFQIPAHLLAPEGPALIYVLDPVSTKLADETASILSLAPGVDVRKELSALFGAPEEAEGVMTFTLPQPLPLPDKTLLVKADGGLVRVAPTLAVLKGLDALIAQGLPALMGPGASVDAALSLRVAAVKRWKREHVELLVEIGASSAAASPKEVALVRQQMNRAFGALDQVETVEALLNFDDAGAVATFDLRLQAAAGSPLAGWTGRQGAALDGKLGRFLGEKSVVWAIWQWNGPAIARYLSAELERQAPPGASAEKEFVKAVLSYVEKVRGEMGLALSGNIEDGVAFSGVAASAASMELSNGFALGLEQAEAVLKREQAPLKIARSPEGVAGRQVFTLEGGEAFDNTGLLRWPLKLAAVRVSDGLFVGMGGALPGVAGEGAPEPVLSDGRTAQIKALPPGTMAAVYAEAVPLAALLLQAASPELEINFKQVCFGLPEGSVSIFVVRAGNRASLRLEIPASVPGALFIFNSGYRRAALEAFRQMEGLQPPPPLQGPQPAPK